MEFISIAKTDPKYGKSSVKESPAFSEKNSCFWDDGANQHSTVMDSVTKTYYICTISVYICITIRQKHADVIVFGNSCIIPFQF